MNEQQPPRAVGVFENQKQAIDAARALVKAGFAPERMLLLARDWETQDLAALGVKMQHAAVGGSATGAAVGGSIGAAAGLLSLLIPGIGVGVFALTALAAATGAATGSLLGAFAGMELSEADWREHHPHIEQGRTVLIVQTTNRSDEANKVLVQHGAYDFSMSTD